MDTDQKSYMQKLADKIIEWDKRIDDLKKQGNEAASVMKEDYNRVTTDLKSKKQEAEARLAELKSVSGESWNELKRGTEQAVEELSKAVSNALSKFKKKQ